MLNVILFINVNEQYIYIEVWLYLKIYVTVVIKSDMKFVHTNWSVINIIISMILYFIEIICFNEIRT